HRGVRARLSWGARRHARAELPLDAVDPRRGQPRHRPQPQPQAEAALVGAWKRAPRAGRRDRRRARRGALRRGRDRLGDRRRRERTLAASGYMDMLEAERTFEAQGRIENLQELVGVAREYEERGQEDVTLDAFLQEISLFSEQDALDVERADVTLMTLHNAKGLEFPIVFIIGMEEGLFPHQRSLEEDSEDEERRLCYVGMTRARERLTLIHAHS